MSGNIFEEIAHCCKSQTPAVLAIVTNSEGSAPQKPGAKMLIRPDGSIAGTVGGGSVEADVIKAALKILEQGGAPRNMHFELTRRNGFMCGGAMSIYIEPLLPAPRLVIAGAGHVGKALATLSSFCGFRTAVIDDRSEYANREHFPTADTIVVDDFIPGIQKISVDTNTSFVIATRGHEHDYEVLEEALRTPSPFIGVVGSRKKRNGFIESLLEAGFEPEDIIRMHLPVGISIGSVTPEEIAVSIMAQIVEKRRKDRTRAASCPASSDFFNVAGGYARIPLATIGE